MTREEAIEILKAHHMWTGEPQEIIDVRKENKALDMAIQALSQEPTDTWSIKDVADTFKKYGIIREQEPCEDAVSRQAVIYYIKGHIHEIITESGTDKNAHTNSILKALINGVETMPTVNPQPCDDAISREQLLKVVSGDSFKSDFPRMSKALVEIIKALPPVSTTKNIVNHGTMNISL